MGVVTDSEETESEAGMIRRSAEGEKTETTGEDRLEEERKKKSQANCSNSEQDDPDGKCDRAAREHSKRRIEEIVAVCKTSSPESRPRTTVEKGYRSSGRSRPGSNQGCYQTITQAPPCLAIKITSIQGYGGQDHRLYLTCSKSKNPIIA